MSRTIVVSGAASGLGEAVMLTLIGQGWQVAALDIAAADVPEAAKAYRCDVTDADAVDAVITKVRTEMGEIFGAVACAGIAPSAKIVGRKGQHDPALFAKVLTVNTIGTFNLICACASQMMQNTPDANGQRGVIITTASVAAYEGQIGQIAYAASKGAVAAMTLPAARELARDGIRVLSIAPGVFDTPMMQGMPEEVRASIASTIPFPPKLGSPEDFAALAAHLIENVTMNGEVVRIDGALRMAGK
ncbi:MAG: SDR family NAD(P)-dependent oxidoreductase [Pseudomonadota bacterium]